MQDGAQVSIAKSEFGEIPGIDESVTITMLVNVAAPGLLVSLRWGDNFEVITMGEDSISKPLVERVCRQSALIVKVVELGQAVIGNLHRVVGEVSEPIEAFADDHLDSPNAATDVMQIYRAAIAHAFTRDKAPVKDSHWRSKAFTVWQPLGVSTALADQAMFNDFLEICGMPVMVRMEHNYLIDSNIAGSEVDAQRISDELFEAINGISRARYNEVAERAMVMFEAKGLTVFGTCSLGDWVSLI